MVGYFYETFIYGKYCMKHFLSIGLISSVLVLAGAGCSRSLTERALEQAAGGDADINLRNGQVSVNVNGASWQAGANVSLPSNFPSDVYVIDGTIVSALANTGEQVYAVSIQTAMSVTAAAAQYRQQLTDRGWTITATGTYGPMENIVATKSDRTVAVVITAGDDRNALVTLSESAATK